SRSRVAASAARPSRSGATPTTSRPTRSLDVLMRWRLRLPPHCSDHAATLWKATATSQTGPMKGFEPSLLEKLFDDEPRATAASGIFKSISLDQYKESVARDLEGLLNSRAAF